jgi:hypothetical protein
MTKGNEEPKELKRRKESGEFLKNLVGEGTSICRRR